MDRILHIPNPNSSAHRIDREDWLREKYVKKENELMHQPSSRTILSRSSLFPTLISEKEKLLSGVSSLIEKRSDYKIFFMKF